MTTSGLIVKSHIMAAGSARYVRYILITFFVSAPSVGVSRVGRHMALTMS